MILSDGYIRPTMEERMNIRDLCTEYLERVDELARIEAQVEAFRERALVAREALVEVTGRMRNTVNHLIPKRAVVIEERVVLIEESKHDPAVTPPTISVLEVS